MKKIFILLFLVCGSVTMTAQNTADSLLNFIQSHKDKSAIYLVQNDSLLAQVNENKMMPLASTVKILVAIEFAKQAGLKVLDENSYVAVKELDKYYIPNTDGGAHPSWIAYEKRKGNMTNDSARLIDVARGMIMFSSNANTEFLMDLLGLENVKSNIQLLGIKQHSSIYPIVSSLFLYQNPKNKTEESIIRSIRKMPDQSYSRFISNVHQALKYDTVLKSKFRPQDLSLNMQKLWSDRLPASTAKDYARVCNVLNNRRFFTPASYAVLSTVMETIMQNPANQQWLKHAGMKGGSTASVLTKALYATTTSGTRIEMAYFLNDLSVVENQKLQKWMNSFELAILSDNSFRKKVSATLR